MSPASMAGLIRGISTTCGCMRPVLAGRRRPFPSFTWSVRWTKGTISLPARYGLASAPSSVRIIRHGMSSGRFPAVFSKLSKLLNQENALSAPCLQHFRNYCGAIEVARCGFPWEKTTKRPVASVYTNCETAYAVTSTLRRLPVGRRNAADRRDPSLLMSHYRLRSPSHHADKR
jgi:hypothetical protein